MAEFGVLFAQVVREVTSIQSLGTETGTDEELMNGGRNPSTLLLSFVFKSTLSTDEHLSSTRPEIVSVLPELQRETTMDTTALEKHITALQRYSTYAGRPILAPSAVYVSLLAVSPEKHLGVKYSPAPSYDSVGTLGEKVMRDDSEERMVLAYDFAFCPPTYVLPVRPVSLPSHPSHSTWHMSLPSRLSTDIEHLFSSIGSRPNHSKSASMASLPLRLHDGQHTNAMRIRILYHCI